MSVRFSEDFEVVLDQAAKIDEHVHDSWAEMMGDAEYAKLLEFFSRDNFFDSWEEEDYDRDTVIKNLKRILVGTDRITLINYAFDLGRLVGKAEYTVLNQNDD